MACPEGEEPPRVIYPDSRVGVMQCFAKHPKLAPKLLEMKSEIAA